MHGPGPLNPGIGAPDRSRRKDQLGFGFREQVAGSPPPGFPDVLMYRDAADCRPLAGGPHLASPEIPPFAHASPALIRVSASRARVPSAVPLNRSANRASSASSRPRWPVR